MKEMICIICPRGCRMTVDEENGYTVSGNGCARGEVYGVSEAKDPVRIVTSTVPCRGLSEDRCPVKTAGGVPKAKIFEVTAAIKQLRLAKPVRMGDVLIPDVCGTGVDVVATKSVS